MNRTIAERSDRQRPVADERIRPQQSDLIHVLFERQAAARPDAVALTMEGVGWTYGQLDATSNLIADAVSGAAPVDGALIGVHMDRSFEMLACLLGVMKAGAAYLPLDPTLPKMRLNQIIQDARPALLIGRKDAVGLFSASGCTLLPVEAAMRGRPVTTARVSRDVAPDAIAYVMYTSGSTGQPKGVEISHAAVINLLGSIRVEPGFSARDVLLAATRMSFDVSVLDFFLPLACGARIEMVAQDVASDPHRLALAIDASGATVMQATPATWRGLLEAGWTGASRLRLWCGGEALPRDLADRLLPRCRELWNMYGPTETTVWSTVHRVMPGDGDVPIGRPIANTKLHILDAMRKPVSAGEIGELYIGGAGLASGYRDRAALTAEKFITLSSGLRAYRTGDLAREAQDGSLYCLGRADDQVKIRGHRVEMGEVEAALATFPGTGWCAIRCWPDRLGENALYAYVVASSGAQITTAALRKYLSDLLPAYMVPQRTLLMAALPLTSNGKIDRNALPHPDSWQSTDMDAQLNTKILTDSERRLAAIWDELLSPGAIGPEDDFFDLGGYSLLTVRLIRRLAEEFGRRLSIADLLAASTLSDMARLLDEGGEESRRPALFDLQPHGDGLPLVWLDGGPLIRNAARSAGERNPILGLNLPIEQEQEIGADSFSVTTLAELISDNLEDVMPSGALCIGGWCRWGIVAFEVARCLRARGREIALLIMLDSQNPGHRPFTWKWRQAASRWPALTRWKRGHQRQPSFSQRVEEATRRHHPKPYAGRVLLLQPQDAAPDTLADGGWRPLVLGGLTVLEAPGNHETMVRPPNAEKLGALIQRAMAELPPS